MSHFSSGDGRAFSLSPALHYALISADAQHRASLDVLREAICEYVEDLREQGMPRHEVANAIRRRVTEMRSSGVTAPLAARVDGIVDELVASCLEPSERPQDGR